MKRTGLILFAICLLAAFLRFYKLGQVPYGLYQDETAIGYNAYSLLQTGKDEYGKRFPLYFKSFGDYKLPVYIYLTTLPVRLLGLTEVAVRAPSAIFGFLTVPLFFLFVKKISEDDTLALMASSLLAINPWHLHYSRATFEVSIALFLFVAGSWLLLLSLTEGKRWAFLGGTVCFIVSFYSYNLTRLLAPLLFAAVYLASPKKSKLTHIEKWLTIVTVVAFLTPFVYTFFQSGGVNSAKGTLIFSSASVQASLLEFRSYMSILPQIVQKAFFSIPALTVWQYLENVLSYISIPFFFLAGSFHGNHGIGTVGQFYLIELPFFIFGIRAAVKSKNRWPALASLWAIVTIVVAALTREAPHATRSFFLIAPIIMFNAYGIQSFLTGLQKQRHSKVKVLITLIMAAIFLYNITYYAASYYVRFPVSYAKSWRSADKELSEFLEKQQTKYDKIIIDKQSGFIYSSLLFYTSFPPAEFINTVIRAPDDSEGFSEVVSFGKYEFREIDWNLDYQKPKTLIVTTPIKKPESVPPLVAFYYPKRPVVLALKQEIHMFPIQDIAYVAISTTPTQ